MPIKLRQLLFVAFTLMATVPIVLLGTWTQRIATQKEIDAVGEKHLLVARNLTAALSRYVTDLDAVFRLAGRSAAQGFDDLPFAPLLESFHFTHLCVIDATGKVVGEFFSPGNESRPAMDPATVERVARAADDAQVHFTGVMPGVDGEPRIYMALRLGAGRLAIGELATDYFVRTQRAIAFGEKGHAAIVDSTGRVLAHPNRAWNASMKDLSGIEPVRRMMAGETGVSIFHSPAVDAEMIAGYTAVPRVGWGVMVPQPMAELEARTRDVRNVTMGVMVLGVVVAAALSWWLAGRLASPVLAVTRAARALAEGSPEPVAILDRRAPAELHSLTETFNGMVAEIASANHALTRQSSLLQATLDNMAEGITLIDRDRNLVLCNRRFTDLFGLPAHALSRPVSVEEILRQQVADGEFGTVPDAEARVRAEIQRMRSGSACMREHVRPDGTVIEVRCNPLADGGVVSSYTDITERKRAEQQASHLARHDGLTGLANRLEIRDRLEAALAEAEREGGNCAFHFVDLNQFKDINDTLGHSVGDTLLGEVAARLGRCAGEGDTIGRIGGDEFAVVQAAVTHPDDAAALARRIVEDLGAPYRHEGGELHLGAAVGITIAPRDGDRVEELYRNADLAMYAAKADAGEGFGFYEPEMAQRVRERKMLEQDFRAALARGELAVHYQPCVDSVTGRVTAAEALLRWHHPVRGNIEPATFIPLAESTGLIVPVGAWVLRTACAYAASLHARGLAPIRISVNISAVQLRQSTLVDTVTRTLAETGLDGRRLVLEITESTAMEDVDSAVRTLRELVGSGVGISIDDFGAGHSSLLQLKRLPVDQIKMDRTFVQGLGGASEDAALVEAILGLGRGLGLPVVAEGVETEGQLRYLRERGCAALQGFHVGRPMTADAFSEWLAGRHAATPIRGHAASG